MSVNNLLTVQDAGIYYSESFKSVIENYLSILATDEYTLATVEGYVALRNDSNYYGVLSELKVPYDLWWITLRVNGYHDPIEYDQIVRYVKVPNKGYIDKLLQKHLSNLA